jgi:predicted N-acetyltransferase YhbS
VPSPSAVTPSAQGRGIGARLIEPTLAEADAAGALCYLETFDDRNPRFYQRLGFSAVGSHEEPVTSSPYTIMIRRPKPVSRSGWRENPDDRTQQLS